MTSRQAAVSAGLSRLPEPEAGRGACRGPGDDVPPARLQRGQAGRLQALAYCTRRRRRRWRRRHRGAEGVWRRWRSRRGGGRGDQEEPKHHEHRQRGTDLFAGEWEVIMLKVGDLTFRCFIHLSFLLLVSSSCFSLYCFSSPTSCSLTWRQITWS